jgi:cell division protein FtsX
MRRYLALGCAVMSACAWFMIATPAHASAAPGKEVELGKLDDFDAEVFMEVRATHPQLGRVRTELQRLPAVRRFAFLDKHDAYQEFSRIFRDEPKLVKNTDASSLPTSFRVDLASSDDRFPFRQQLEALRGVDTVVITLTDEERQQQRASRARSFMCRGNVEAQVFMVVNSTPSQEQAVADALAATVGVDSVRRIGHDEAKTIFDCLFADEPDLVASTTPEQLPVSFQLDLANGGALARVLRTISDMPGVDEIKH